MLSLIGENPKPRCLTRKFKVAILGRIFSITPLKKEPHSTLLINACLPRDIFESYCFLRKEYKFSAVEVFTHGVIDLCQQWDGQERKTKKSWNANMIQCRRLVKHIERIVNTTRNGRPFAYKVRSEAQHFLFQEEKKSSTIGAHEDDIVTIADIQSIAHRRTGFVEVSYFLRSASQTKKAKVPASRISKALLMNYGIEDAKNASLAKHKELVQSGAKVSYADYETEQKQLNVEHKKGV